MRFRLSTTVQRGYKLVDEPTLRDLPAVLDTFVVLEEEREEEKLEDDERAERKERERVRAKERRRPGKVGEWGWRSPRRTGSIRRTW